MQLDDRVTLATPEGVALELILAGLGSRFLARLLDTVIQVVLIIALGVGVVIGVTIPLLAFRWFAPNEVFPVVYRRGRSAHLDVGGARGVAMMQSSGVGNCVNMFSFVKNGQFPMLILVSMRGDFGEGNPWQMPMGQTIQPILETCGFICMRVDQPEEVTVTLQAACTMVYQAGQAVAVLLSQRLIGAKAF